MLAQLPGRHRRHELLAEAASSGQFHQLMHRLRHLRHCLPDGCVELRRNERAQAGEVDESEGPDGVTHAREKTTK